MEEIKQSDLNLLKKNMRLSDKEAENAARFMKKHRACTTESRSLANVQYTISFSETPVGSFVKIGCEKCHSEEDISDDVRSNY